MCYKRWKVNAHLLRRIRSLLRQQSSSSITITQRDREGTRSSRVSRSKEEERKKNCQQAQKKQHNTFHARCVNHKKERNQPEKIEHFQYAIIRQSQRWPQPRRRSGCLLVDLHRIRFDSFHSVFSAFIPISTHINIIIIVVVQLPSLLFLSVFLLFSRIHVCTYDRFSDNKINISICKQLRRDDKKDEEKNYYFDSEKNRRAREKRNAHSATQSPFMYRSLHPTLSTCSMSVGKQTHTLACMQDVRTPNYTLLIWCTTHTHNTPSACNE